MILYEKRETETISNNMMHSNLSDDKSGLTSAIMGCVMPGMIVTSYLLKYSDKSVQSWSEAQTSDRAFEVGVNLGNCYIFRDLANVVNFFGW